jgi:branched-chain amino acid transport system ATP-binding protein
MLEVTNLAVAYGRHRALEGVGLKVAKGEICVILGANGAGKSTLLKAIAGMVKADAGEVVMNGRPVTTLKAHRIVEEGIALVPEGRGIFGDLSVAENLQLGAFAQRARRDEQATLKTVYDLFPRLAERKRQAARTMSGGEQQMVAIGRALMSRPDILMLDEPSLGLSPILTQELFRSLTAVAATGVGILLVEQNARQSLKIARRGYLIENGHVTGEASAEALRSDPAVIAAYLGGAAAKIARPAVHLPPSIRLPATLDAIGRMAGDLAGRAGSISQAFVRAMRGAETPPSAFVGRYDPKAGGDPWAAMAAELPQAAANPAGPPPVAEDAKWLASSSANLAARASERLAQQIASARRGAPVPSAFQARPKEEAATSLPATPDSAPGERRAETSKLNGSHGLIGHNSAAAGLDDDSAGDTGAAPSGAGTLDIADLAARAAAIQRRHIEAQRRATPADPAAATVMRAAGTKAEPASTDEYRPERSGPERISIADLAARADAVQKRHVDSARKALTAFTVPAATMPAVAEPPRENSGKAAKKGKKGKKTKPGKTSARKGKNKQ